MPAASSTPARPAAGRKGVWTRHAPAAPAKPAAPETPPSPLGRGRPFYVEERRDGLHLIRRRDGADMGIMASRAVAATQATGLARMGSA